MTVVKHDWIKDDPETIITDEFLKILNLIEFSDQSIYITGVAGTGKSKLLSLLQLNSNKSYVVLAPTGVSALKVGGATLHSFFRLPIGLLNKNEEDLTYNRKLAKLYLSLDMVIIDEISMVRADVLDAIDYTLRLHRKSELPFGGVQMVFFGDIMQLPPVVSGQSLYEYFEHNYGGIYFFNAKVYQKCNFVQAELTKVFRQKDQNFVEILNNIRLNRVDNKILQILNSRFSPNKSNLETEVLTLCTTNKISSEINERKMAELKTKPFTYKAEIEGEFNSKFYPTEAELVLKEGAQIMMLRNDPDKRWVNGNIGTIKRLTPDNIIVTIDKVDYDIKKVTWELKDYIYDNTKNKIECKTIGSFTQYPMQLAWAITIHKSQGQTYDKVNINLGRGAFAHGQVYVALSRCRSFEGISLQTKIYRRDILVDPAVNNFIKEQVLL